MSLIISHKGENDSIALDMVMVRMMVYFSCLSALWCQYSRVYSVKYTLRGWFFLVQILILSDSCPDFGSFYFWPDFDPFIFLSRFWSFLYFCPDFDPFFIFCPDFDPFLFFDPDFDPFCIFVQILIFSIFLSRFWSFFYFFVQILILFCFLIQILILFVFLSRFWSFKKNVI